ncbi:hypothetical protein SLEP1_g50764 [Rubroshorea leprosula]|uniref:Uncharacterized protein n=1 Tax=Rubroshorea leprosula TaxID=152421 RepID=A0AAV5M113_9ROSI|nr:hypothetical protein SLEP1_g50764 [Rubroshorea leprosula]
MPPLYFPLRWESTGEQWWYASPIDWAAANGLYDLVIELLHLDTNHLIKLTSLRRIRRLETVWDDEAQFHGVAKCRSYVARRLLHECEMKKGNNSLLRAGYGGWLLYTAASAGDVAFVKELLERDPLLVFGEGEFGVTDMVYAAARSKNSEVFRLLLDFSFSSRCCLGEAEEQELSEGKSVFKAEMMNRAVHAAARGGNLQILKELLEDCHDVLVYRDEQGSTILHTASGRGQVEVAKDLVSSFDIITSTDNQGNTALHVAAYRGHLAVLEVLVLASPSVASVTNNHGDTFLHMAVDGFRAPGFRQVDRQIELMKQLVSGKVMDIREIVNVRNMDGRTALHVAVIENIQSSVVELLMSVPSIDLNVPAANGMTPLDFLKQRPRSASSEVLIKELIAAGGISNYQDYMARSVIASHLKGQAICASPGTSFRIPDAEIFLYTGTENASSASYDQEIAEDYSRCLSEVSDLNLSNSMEKKKTDSASYAARRLKFLLQWPVKKGVKARSTELELVEDEPLEVSSRGRSWADRHIPLRQKYSNSSSSLLNDGRTYAFNPDLPSPTARKKFTAGLMQGVIQPRPFQSPPSPSSGSFMSSPVSVNQLKALQDQLSNDKKINGSQRHGSFNKKLMNQYFCFGTEGLAVVDPVKFTRSDRSYQRVSSSVS